MVETSDDEDSTLTLQAIEQCTCGLLDQGAYLPVDSDGDFLANRSAFVLGGYLDSSSFSNYNTSWLSSDLTGDSSSLLQISLPSHCYKLMGPFVGLNATAYVNNAEFLNHVSSAICFLGLIGNLANVFFLIPQGQKCGMRRMEKSVYWGLISLACSDLMFCLCIIPRSFAGVDPASENLFDFSLVYFVYGDALAHLFAMISTWLTVAMALGRYLAICKPFTARAIIGRTAAKRTISGIIVACIMMSLPRFFFYRIESLKCSENSTRFYFRWPVTGLERKHSDVFSSVYNWFYFIVGIIVPFLCLTSSNAFLIKTLGRATTTLRYCRVVRYNRRYSQQLIRHQLQRQTSPQQLQRQQSHIDQYRPITMTLIVLVIAYIVLFTPSELFLFLRRCFLDDSQKELLFNLLCSIANILQATNFSLNFLLYYAINVNFRRSVSRFFCCIKPWTRSLCHSSQTPASPNVNEFFDSQPQPHSSAGTQSLNTPLGVPHYLTRSDSACFDRKPGIVQLEEVFR